MNVRRLPRNSLAVAHVHIAARREVRIDRILQNPVVVLWREGRVSLNRGTARKAGVDGWGSDPQEIHGGRGIGSGNHGEIRDDFVLLSIDIIHFRRWRRKPLQKLFKKSSPQRTMEGVLRSQLRREGLPLG
jgi:hypothetical protein